MGGNHVRGGPQRAVEKRPIRGLPHLRQGTERETLGLALRSAEGRHGRELVGCPLLVPLARQRQGLICPVADRGCLRWGCACVVAFPAASSWTLSALASVRIQRVKGRHGTLRGTHTSCPCTHPYDRQHRASTRRRTSTACSRWTRAALPNPERHPSCPSLPSFLHPRTLQSRSAFIAAAPSLAPHAAVRRRNHGRARYVRRGQDRGMQCEAKERDSHACYTHTIREAWARRRDYAPLPTDPPTHRTTPHPTTKPQPSTPSSSCTKSSRCRYSPPTHPTHPPKPQHPNLPPKPTHTTTVPLLPR